MYLKKNLIIFLVTFIFSNTAINQTYDADLLKKDFYVNGLLANDSLQDINFLICFVKNMNPSSFVDAGAYVSLVDAESCESADGANSALESSLSQASSADGTTADAEITADTTSYTKATSTIEGIVDTNILQGKSWVEVNQELADDSGRLYPMLVYALTEQKEDVSEENPNGVFNLSWEVKNKNDITMPSGYFIPANKTMEKGIVDVTGNAVSYLYRGESDPGSTVYMTFSNDEVQLVLTVPMFYYSGENFNNLSYYTVSVQGHFDKTAKIFCQKFIEGQEMEWSQNNGFIEKGPKLNASDIDTLINTSGTKTSLWGGSKNRLTGEHCWSTDSTKAKRYVWEYGTYKESDGTKYDIPLASMSLRASAAENLGLDKTVYGHASYWGGNVDSSDRAFVSNDTLWRNSNDSNDENLYRLITNYYRVTEISTSRHQLVEFDKMSFQFYAGWLKSDQWASKTKILLNGGEDFTGNCDAIDRNCPEYFGTISVSDGVVTFTISGGMDFSNQNGAIDFNVPIVFTNTDWINTMTHPQHNYLASMWIWDEDNRINYHVPPTAFQNPSNAVGNDRVSSRNEKNISLSQLPNSVFCLERCIDALKVSQTMGSIIRASDTSYEKGALSITPNKNIGPFFKEQVYRDDNRNNIKDAGEPDYPAGYYNNIGGIKESDIAVYTISDSRITDNKIDAGASNVPLTWPNSIYVTVPSSGGIELKKTIDGMTYEIQEEIEDYEYYEKDPSITTDNYTRRNHGDFSMRVLPNTAEAKNLIECDRNSDVNSDTGNNEYNGYHHRFKKIASPAERVYDQNAIYLCRNKIYDNDLTHYRIGLRTRVRYDLYNQTNLAKIDFSPPERFTYTVPDSGIKYNFSGISHSGKKIKLDFEGFGELWNFPRRVYDKCTDQQVGKYVSDSDWNGSCYRSISEFMLPDGAVLENIDPSKTEKVKVIALRGDDFLKQLSQEEVGAHTRNYALNLSDLPSTALIKDTGSSDSNDFIGNMPTEGILNNGDPSVIHGTVVFEPSQASSSTESNISSSNESSSNESSSEEASSSSES